MMRNIRQILNALPRTSIASLLQSSRRTVVNVAEESHVVDVLQGHGVREITLNDPKTRNSLSMNMMDQLLKGIETDLKAESLRCIVLSAEGNVWSAGHNLKELANAVSPEEQWETFNKLTQIIQIIRKAPVPVIAKVNGLAAAAGCQLACSCDMVVCSDKSTFSTPGAGVGIFCSTPGVAISRLMPRLRSSYMLMTGLPLTAEEAYTAGLVTAIAREQELDVIMQTITGAIKAKSRAVVALGKEFYYNQLGMDICSAYAAGAEKMVENLGLDDGKEGLKSFLEKRPPKWTHKG